MFILYIFVFAISSLITFRFWKRLTYNTLINTPIFLVALLYQVIGDAFAFKELNESIYLYFSLFMIIGSIIEIIVVVLCKYNYNNVVPNKQSINVPVPFIYFIAGGAVFILITSLSYAQQYGIVSDAFEAKMGSGIIGHALVFLMITPPFIYLAYANKKINKLTFIVCIMLVFSCLFLKQVKSWIMIPAVYFFVMYLYYNNVNKKRLMFHSILVTVILFMFFFLVYYFKNKFLNSDSDSWILIGQIYQHFLFYLFSGIGAFSEYLNANMPENSNSWYVLILPIVNTVHFFSGEPMQSAINPMNYIINYEISNSSNVFTMVGTLLMYLNNYSFLFYGIIVMFQSVLFISRKNVVACNVFWLITSFGLFSWFEYYYFHLASYEAPLYVLILSVIFSGKKSEKQLLNSHS
ncbi:TPA: oligosaccharide repeat unit polymerase [Escherichia coli]|uniref:DUF6337 family protein n=2 Tax=Escherichia coli TaxID=562 RepID=UPI00184D3873|nr:DUF6337 family protein [Escherichia coli]EFK3482059.1 oligosaccharide repeat unit polymerase [Escherichia coli]EHY5470489.1 oligosaccharide repeat unit polymerase [Escherichia coli]EIQ0496656.1 oligosaccharide repeat unit polymerase [Escherichia coli]MCA8665284.1 oligosaccharide repeat unit polymerase [Escherichia coli]MCT6438821.1 oligosaccharide repeat unit polymerase [Escherichia coli]